MILCRRPLWTAPEQKNSKVKHKFRAIGLPTVIPQTLYTVQSLYKKSMVIP